MPPLKQWPDWVKILLSAVLSFVISVSIFGLNKKEDSKTELKRQIELKADKDYVDGRFIEVEKLRNAQFKSIEDLMDAKDERDEERYNSLKGLIQGNKSGNFVDNR